MRGRGGDGRDDSVDENPGDSDESADINDNWPFGALGLDPEADPEPAKEPAVHPIGATDSNPSEEPDWDAATRSIAPINWNNVVSARPARGSRRLTNPDDDQSGEASGDTADWDMPTQAINHIVFTPNGSPNKDAPTQAMGHVPGWPEETATDKEAGTPTQAMTGFDSLLDADARPSTDASTDASTDTRTDATELLNQPFPSPSCNPGPAPFAGLQPTLAPAGLAAAPAAAHPPERNLTKSLTWIVAGLLGVLILVGLFFLGTRLPSNQAAARLAPVGLPSTNASAPSVPRAASTPIPEKRVTGPVAPGEYKWDELLGGECLQPYSTVWQEEFTVVDCDFEHAAQMVYVGTFDSELGPDFPGEDGLAGKMNVLCSTPDIINFDAAKDYSDIQIQGSYPVTDEQWTEGDRSYYCFVSRSGSEPIEGSLAAADEG